MRPRIRAAFALIALLPLAAPAVGADLPRDEPPVPLRLEVSRAERQLVVRVGDRVARTYPVAIGTPSHPTPGGAYTLDRIIWNPAWYPPDSEWADGLEPAKPGSKRNPLQVAKIPFRSLYYIHGTDQPDSVGSAASHGCIRMRPEDVKDLARTLMEATGAPRDPAWYDFILASGRSEEVPLGAAVELVVD